MSFLCLTLKHLFQSPCSQHGARSPIVLTVMSFVRWPRRSSLFVVLGSAAADTGNPKSENRAMPVIFTCLQASRHRTVCWQHLSMNSISMVFSVQGMYDGATLSCLHLTFRCWTDGTVSLHNELVAIGVVHWLKSSVNHTGQINTQSMNSLYCSIYDGILPPEQMIKRTRIQIRQNSILGELC